LSLAACANGEQGLHELLSMMKENCEDGTFIKLSKENVNKCGTKTAIVDQDGKRKMIYEEFDI
jgi:hypothetical protein